MSSEKLDLVKQEVAHVEQAQNGFQRPAVIFSGKDEDRLYRKLDLRILPVLAVLYLLSFLDRGNIGNARLAGLEADLGMSPSDYALALSLFFVSYALFEVPSNLVLTKIRPSIWISFLAVAWGTCSTLMGVVQNHAGLVATRFFLGLAEAGLFPGVILLLTWWYPRDRLQTRVGLFFSAATIAGAFSGLLAYGIGFMAGTGTLYGEPMNGWRWIFILEGLLTVIVGGLSYFALVDRPEQAKFLTDDERAWIIYRKATDGSSVGETHKIKWLYVKRAFSDFQPYFAMGYYFSILIPLYGVGLFMPTLIQGLNRSWTRPQVQLLTVPVYVIACIYVIGIAIVSDRVKTRFPFLVLCQSLCVIGFTIQITPAPLALKFIGVILCCMGAYGGVPSMISWFSGNLAGSAKRATATGLVLGVGSLGGIVSSNIYRTGGPRFFVGHGTELGVSVFGIICSCLYAFFLRRANRAKDAEATRQSQLQEYERRVYTTEELQDLGDKSPEFYYTI
ncbi:hypothetical protein OIO90_003017 [Microbotryomycetes sp. JL221]|nr:hypothetical protein OIO90_003017 [Microbotryomycetes sp. JL221]